MNEFEQKLEQIVGKTFFYKGNDVKIDKYKSISSGSNYVVFVDGRPINFLPGEIDFFLSELCDPLGREKKKTEILVPIDLEKNKTEVSVPVRALAAFEPTKENAEIKKTLLEVLEKVKSDPGYIDQAKSVCGVVNQFVQIQKNEIQMLNTLEKFR